MNTDFCKIHRSRHYLHRMRLIIDVAQPHREPRERPTHPGRRVGFKGGTQQSAKATVDIHRSVSVRVGVTPQLHLRLPNHGTVTQPLDMKYVGQISLADGQI